MNKWHLTPLNTPTSCSIGNYNKQSLKKHEKRIFIQHCLRSMSAPPSIKWSLSIDTVFTDGFLLHSPENG
ncbi:hypothetical protein FQ012_25525, partial [Escherichia coli]|uniref:hypothetical protein n=1 Tax=Escherichia coli TaxID=562 RepID=UPI00139B7D0A